MLINKELLGDKLWTVAEKFAYIWKFEIQLPLHVIFLTMSIMSLSTTTTRVEGGFRGDGKGAMPPRCQTIFSPCSITLKLQLIKIEISKGCVV